MDKIFKNLYENKVLEKILQKQFYNLTADFSTEKVNLEMDAPKLKVLRNSFKEEQFRLTDLVKKNTENIEFNKNILAKSETDTAKFLSEKSEEKPQITIDGKTFAERKDCGEKLDLLIAKVLKEEIGTEISVGEIDGFELKLKVEEVINGKCVDCVIQGELAYTTGLSPDNALGNITRIENAFANIPKRLGDLENNLDKLNADIQSAEKELKKTFSKEEEYQQKTDRLEELNLIFMVQDDIIAEITDDDSVAENLSSGISTTNTENSAEKNLKKLIQIAKIPQKKKQKIKIKIAIPQVNFFLDTLLIFVRKVMIKSKMYIKKNSKRYLTMQFFYVTLQGTGLSEKNKKNRKG